METFEAFQLYHALKQHFTTDYDYFKYNGKCANMITRYKKLTEAQKYPYKKISGHSDPKGLLIANLLINPSVWITSIMVDGSPIYSEWLKRQESITYLFKNELGKIYLDDFEVNDGQHPNLLMKVMGQVISLETLIILNNMSKFFDEWSEQINDDLIWPNLKKKALKYAPFLKYDGRKMRELVVKHFQE